MKNIMVTKASLLLEFNNDSTNSPQAERWTGCGCQGEMLYTSSEIQDNLISYNENIYNLQYETTLTKNQGR